MSDGSNSTAKIVGLVGAVIAAAAGAAGLLFTINPDLKPCIGGVEAKFTGAPVFPGTTFGQNLRHTNTPEEEIAKDPERNEVGAEVRVSFKVSGLRGERFDVYYSLVSVERDGSLGRVDAEQDRNPSVGFESEACSEDMGADVFVRMPAQSTTRRRYRVVLELYRIDDFDQRLALFETDIFRG